MRFAFDDTQLELKRGARAFLAAASSPARVRAASTTDEGFEADVWRRIATELAWPALLVPEAYGGAGCGFVELAAVLEETGRALLCAPLFATACLATPLLAAAASEEQKGEVLGAVAAGEATATLAWADDASAPLVAERADGGLVLRGGKRFVLDGHTATWLLVEARDAEAGGSSLFLVRGDARGLARSRVATLDATRPQASLAFDGVRVAASARVGAPGEGASRVAWAVQRAAVGLAAEQVGGAERCLEMALDYAKTRVQFGRVIGSFQAIKHKLADMFVDVETSRSAAYHAAWAASVDDPDLPLSAAQAKAWCSEAFFRVASENLQIHGGIGFTWEHDAHLWFKRARSSEALLGDPASHRDAFAASLGL